MVADGHVGSDGVGIADLVLHQEGVALVAFVVALNAHAVGLTVLVLHARSSLAHQSTRKVFTATLGRIRSLNNGGRKLAVLPQIGVGGPVLAQQVAQGESGRKVVERIRSRR